MSLTAARSSLTALNLPPFPFTILDTETTGFVPHRNGIIEFACVRCEGGEVVDTYEQLIHVDRSIPDVVSVLTRIRDSDLEGKPMMDDVREEILSHIGSDTMIVCQNTPFDLKMLKGDGIDLTERPWIDTAMLASLVYPELRSFSLGYVSRVLELNHDPVHRALGDVHATLELLSHCWERLCNLPPEMSVSAKDIMSRSPKGYAMLFDSVKHGDGTEPPWEQASSASFASFASSASSASLSPLPIPTPGTVHCTDEPLVSGLLQGVIDACATDDSATHWIAVKNLPAALRNLEIPDTVSVLYPPFLVADPDLRNALLAQDTFTNDEATLALKIAWFDPEVEKDIRVHGEERPVWNGKVACTEESQTYLDQFSSLKHTVLLDHRQLLSFLADPKHAGQNALKSGNHIIIDDASMLEDTATKACGSLCQISTLRAIAEGNTELTKFTDLLSLWAERTRQMRDAYELNSQDLGSKETAGILEHVSRLLEKKESLPHQAVRLIENVGKILDTKRLKENISWIETRQDGSIFLQSYPRSIGLFLRSELFDTFATTLLTPPNGIETLTEVLHPKTSCQRSAVSGQLTAPGVNISFPEHKLEELLENPPPGRTVVLLGSKRLIEQLFITRTEELEANGVTLICQSMSGGMERMQAEFLSAKTPVIWALTPWSFEGVFLPPESIDRLVLCSLPFDHPNHIIFSKRAEKYQNAFMEYALPRLLHRLFRILRTFVRCATEERVVDVLDARIREKRYGSVVKDYLEGLKISPPLPRGESKGGENTKPQQDTLF